MFTLRAVLAVPLLLAATAVAAQPTRLLDLSLEDVEGGGRVLNLSFYGAVPPPETVDRILRGSLDHAILVDGSVDILAMAFRGDEELSSNQYSGPLVYVANRKSVVSLDEYEGVRTTTSSTPTYFVSVDEEKTLAGIVPERRWLSMTIVFPALPSQDAAYDAIVAEVERRVAKAIDIDAFVCVGSQGTKASWQQVRDDSGGFIFAEYEAATRTLMHRDRVLKRFP